MKKLTSCFDNLSIANRLAVMYALVATVVLSVIVVVLYILETTEINRYQTAEMKSRFKIIEEHVAETTTAKDWKHLVKNLQEIMIPDGGLYILIQSDDPAFSFAAPYRVDRSQISKNNGFGKISVKGNMHRTSLKFSLRRANGRKSSCPLPSTPISMKKKTFGWTSLSEVC